METPDWKTHAWLAEAMANHGCPGMSICEIRNFSNAWRASIGIRLTGRLHAVSVDTLFQAGSISKAVFALAVMRLVQDGTLDLDVDVNTYLKSWQLATDGRNTPAVTLRHILSHSAATTVQGFPGYVRGRPLPSLIQILNGVAPANTPPVRRAGFPGRQFQYSGGGTTVAQQLVEDMTQHPFPELMRSLVLDPISMGDSGYLQPLPSGWDGRSASGHREDGLPVHGGHRLYPELAAAGLWSTATDLAKLGAAVMRSHHGQTCELGLRPRTLASMVKPQLCNERPGDNFVGLGWFCSGAADDFCISHAGQTEGFVAHLSLLPAKGAGIAIMINSLGGWPLIQRLLDLAGFSQASI